MNEPVQKSTPIMADLAYATLEEILAELARRGSAVVVGLAPLSGKPAYLKYASGDALQCQGLCCVLARHVETHVDPTPAEES
jgi:hypothetical protein